MALLARRLSVFAVTMLVLTIGAAWLGLRLFLPECVSAARRRPGGPSVFQPQFTTPDIWMTAFVMIVFGVTYFAMSVVL